MTSLWARWGRALMVGAALAAACWDHSVGAAGVAIDAKEVELPAVLRLIAAQGGPTIVADPSVAQERVTFAVKEVQPYAALRWLCRACGFVVVSGQGGRLLIGRPALDKAILEEYNVAPVAATPAGAEALLDFTKRVVLPSYLNRIKAEDGEVLPQLEATFEKGRLKILAPPMVQREVATLLRTVAQAKKGASADELRVAYRPYELGMLNPRSPALAPAPLRGEVSLDLAQASAYEAAWAMTSASKASFFIDPWDEGLRAAKVTLKAEKMPLKTAADQVAKQLVAEPCWFDGAWVLVRPLRRGLFEDFSVRVYSLGGTGVWGNWIAEGSVNNAQWFKLSPGLPYSVNRVGDHVLTALPANAQKGIEAALKGAAEGGKRPFWR